MSLTVADLQKKNYKKNCKLQVISFQNHTKIAINNNNHLMLDILRAWSSSESLFRGLRES
jgi:hypothetical protein